MITREKLIELTGVKSSRLSQFTNGRKSTRGGKQEWEEKPLLENGVDYVREFRGNKGVIMFKDSAIEKIKAKQAGK